MKIRTSRFLALPYARRLRPGPVRISNWGGSYRRKFIALTAAVIGVLGGLATAPGAAASAASPNAQAPHVALTSCGGGIVARSVTPAAGFDPLTATDAQLIANDLPPRPVGSRNLAVWRKFVTEHPETRSTCDLRTGHQGSAAHILRATARGPSGVTPLDTSAHTANWDGQIADNQSYTDAFGTFTVPAARGTATAYSSSWVGVGQGQSLRQPLIQGGSESDALSVSRYYLWWELYPENRQQEFTTNVAPGDTVYVHAHLSYNDDWVVVKDEDTDAGGTYGYSTTSIWPDNTAEWIYERTTVNGYYPRLTDASTSFTGATAYGTGYSGTSLQDLPHYWASMWNCTSASDTELANAGTIAANGAFNTYWMNYGTRSPEKCPSW